MMGYPQLPITLEADNVHVMKLWVDESFDMHLEMKSKKTSTMYLGKGSIHSTSIKKAKYKDLYRI